MEQKASRGRSRWSAGGKYIYKPAVRDGNLITARTWRSHPEFYREVFACLGEIARGAGS